MVVLIVLIVYIIIGYKEIINLYRKKQKRELIIYSITLIFAFVLSIILASGIKLPSYPRIFKMLKTFFNL